jgi:hypothetical protein
MKLKILLSIFLIVSLISSLSFTQQRPAVNFEELITQAEKDFSIVTNARRLAAAADLPHSIYLPEGIFIEAKGIENDKVVYSIINDLLNPYNNGETAYWEEIRARYDLSTARIHWTDKPVQNPRLGYNFGTQSGREITLVIGPESTNDAVVSFNYFDGSLLNASYIPGGNSNLGTPIEALLTYQGNILVSDQVTDKIVEFDTTGIFTKVLYGGNTAILDNARGIELKPNSNSVLSAVAGGTNQDAIAEFDLTTGEYKGNFIAPNSAQMDGPWDIIFRATDCLVAGEASDNIVRYDLNGNYLGIFVASINFPEQIYQASSGDILAAGFSPPSGLYVYDANGVQTNFFTAITGLRGVFQLGNGNYMVTNGAGMHIIDKQGVFISTPAAGVSARSLREVDMSITPVELAAFSADAEGSNVILQWSTITETNNKGFSVERRSVNDNADWQEITFINGMGTTTQPVNYTYTDMSLSAGKYQYRLRQIDFNGSYAYPGIVNVEVGIPSEFSLEQNYPNPFNPSTVVKFSLPAESKVTLKIFDLMGQETAEIINGNYTAGTHAVNINAAYLSSGMYFYTITASGDNGVKYTSSKKMLLIK